MGNGVVIRGKKVKAAKQCLLYKMTTIGGTRKAVREHMCLEGLAKQKQNSMNQWKN